MKTEWDYSTLAQAYLKRPDYSMQAVDAMQAIAGVRGGAMVCDVGAGVAHLTLMMARRGLQVTAVEPNEAMMALGRERTRDLDNVEWHEGTGEATGQAESAFDLVTFGSSFNVCDRHAALVESARILKPRGWFACMWNHRQLDDPIQENIERIIRDAIAGYTYGTRREDQTALIEASGLFGTVVCIHAATAHEQTVAECVEAWKSHATLERQAGRCFGQIIDSIRAYLLGLGTPTIRIPYVTRIWMAQRRAA